MSVNICRLMGVTALGNVMYMCLALGNVSASAICLLCRHLAKIHLCDYVSEQIKIINECC